MNDPIRSHGHNSLNSVPKKGGSSLCYYMDKVGKRVRSLPEEQKGSEGPMRRWAPGHAPGLLSIMPPPPTHTHNFSTATAFVCSLSFSCTLSFTSRLPTLHPHPKIYLDSASLFLLRINVAKNCNMVSRGLFSQSMEANSLISGIIRVVPSGVSRKEHIPLFSATLCWGNL